MRPGFNVQTPNNDSKVSPIQLLRGKAAGFLGFTGQAV